MNLRTIDHKLTCLLHDRSGKWPWLDRLAIFTARDVPFVFVLLPFVYFYFDVVEDGPLIIYFFVYATGLVVSQGLTYLFQRLVHRRRPFQSEHLQPIYQVRIPSPSFPSGHAALVATTITLVVSFTGFMYPILLLTLALLGFLILFARVYGGLHYVSDILAGLLFGAVVTYLFFFSGFL